MQIRIELRSDAAPGAGTGEAGGVDRDVTHDAYGLPLLPARRLKGCLREAALEVQEALQQAGRGELLETEIIEGLFGSAYQTNSRPGYLQLSDAKLEQAAELQPWLKWAAQKEKDAKDTNKEANLFGPAAVLATYTGLRAQTSLSRLTGGPLPNSLRVSRVICRGCRFIAEASLERPVNAPEIAEPALRQALAWSCLALRHIGLSRNRGLGWVKASLHAGDYRSDQALAELTELLELGGVAR